jgi:GntR family transcriptional repressor for pyruvate dehydrogenase complex
MAADLLLTQLEHQLQALQPLVAKSSHELVAQQLRERIDMGLWLPGRPLPSERELAEQLGVGRQTVREAVRRLIAEGRVAPGRPRSAPAVVGSPIDPAQEWRRLRARESEFRDLLEFRKLVEVRAAELAARHRGVEHLALMMKAQGELRTALAVDRPDLFRAADTSFHLAIGAASGSGTLCSQVRSTRGALFPALDVLIVNTGELSASLQEHEQILDAIDMGSSDEAAKMMLAHLTETEVRLTKLLERELTSL